MSRDDAMSGRDGACGSFGGWWRRRAPWLGPLQVVLYALHGCATQGMPPPPPSEVDVGWRVVDEAGENRYVAKAGQAYRGGKPFERTSPVYPVTVEQCPLQIEIKATLIMDEHGAVKDVRFDDAAYDPAFYQSVRAAVVQWKFYPLQVVSTDSSTHAETPVDLPFSLRYAFAFACHGGSRTVLSSGGAP